LIEGVRQAIARLSRARFVCAVVTIQSGLAKGYFPWTNSIAGSRSSPRDGAPAAQKWWSIRLSARFSELCAGKKPNTLLYEQVSREHGVDLPRSFVIGDSADDVLAACRFGGPGCLVRSGWAKDPGEVKGAVPYTWFVAESLSKAVNGILSRPNGTS
jgi:D-glycero-D-manno-heptose 1,7-bisphosphate phosphatase